MKMQEINSKYSPINCQNVKKIKLLVESYCPIIYAR